MKSCLQNDPPSACSFQTLRLLRVFEFQLTELDPFGFKTIGLAANKQVHGLAPLDAALQAGGKGSGVVLEAGVQHRLRLRVRGAQLVLVRVVQPHRLHSSKIFAVSCGMPTGACGINAGMPRLLMRVVGSC